MMTYFLLNYVHIIGASVLLARVVAGVARIVVMADFLFTATVGGSRSAFPAFVAVAVIFWLIIARPPEIWQAHLCAAPTGRGTIRRRSWPRPKSGSRRSNRSTAPSAPSR